MKQKIKDGVYLVADPSREINLLCSTIEQALQGGICAVQLWNNWSKVSDKQVVIKQIHQLTKPKGIPLILNELFEYLDTEDFDGIHLDKPTERNRHYQSQRPDLIWGLTCSNDLNDIDWAAQNKIDYISFCSMFNSKTSNSCELVLPETIKKANEVFTNPIFLAGGINHQTLPMLGQNQFNGIALVSAIMDAQNPKEEVEKYTTEIKKLRYD